MNRYNGSQRNWTVENIDERSYWKINTIKRKKNATIEYTGNRYTRRQKHLIMTHLLFIKKFITHSCKFHMWRNYIIWNKPKWNETILVHSDRMRDGKQRCKLGNLYPLLL